MSKTTPARRTSRARTKPSDPALRPEVDLLVSPRQLDLIPPDDPEQTRSIGLWDMVPWGVLDLTHRRSDDERKLPSIERSFIARGLPFRITLTPAQIKVKVGAESVERQVYPGAREQRVELVIRKIAADCLRYNESNNRVFVEIPVYEIFNELKRCGHTTNYPDIIEAIDILAGTFMTISRETQDRDSDGDGIVLIKKSPIFQSVDIRAIKNDEKIDRMVVNIQMNSLISDAIRKIDFHNLNYEKQMRLRPAALYMFRWLHHTAFYSKVQTREYRISAVQVLEGCGVKQWRLRDQIKVLEADVKQLEAEGIILTSHREDIKEPTAGRPRIVDAEFVVEVSDMFAAQIVRAQGGLAEMRRQWEKDTGLLPADSGWLRTPRSRRRTVTEAPTLDFGASAS